MLIFLLFVICSTKGQGPSGHPAECSILVCCTEHIIIIGSDEPLGTIIVDAFARLMCSRG
jgi:hypothetical protein